MNNREKLLDEQFKTTKDEEKTKAIDDKADLLTKQKYIEHIIFRSKDSEELRSEIQNLLSGMEKHHIVHLIHSVLRETNYSLSDRQRGILKSFLWIPEDVTFILSVIKDNRPFVPIQNESQKFALVAKYKFFYQN